MRILGVDIRLGKTVDADMQKQQNNLRPLEDPNKTAGSGTDGVIIPIYPLPMKSLYDIVAYSDTLSTIIQARRKEIFRHGYDIREKFACKCVDCDKEFDHPVDKCDECQSTNIREPESKQRRVLEKGLKIINHNNQDLIAMSSCVNTNIDTVDDGYMLSVNKYYWDSNGHLLGSEVDEIISVQPYYINHIADETGLHGVDNQGNRIMTCLEHRDESWNNQSVCPRCGKELQNAYYRATTINGKFIYYTKDEVCHRSLFNPSLTTGFSPVFSVWMKAVTLINQDNYVKNYYAKQRPPVGFLFVRTANLASLEKAWQWMLDMFRKNPHMVPPIGVEGDIKGKFVEFVDLMKSLSEMQFVEMREEYRRTIGAVYGVQPIFQADVSTSGGLNNEGLQITVTNRATQDGQNVYNNGFYPWVCERFGVTDYIIVLKQPEEKDAMAKLQIESQRIQNAKAMQDMGFEVTLNEDNEFEYGPLEVPVQPNTNIQPSSPQTGPGQDEPSLDFTGSPEDVERDSGAVTSNTPGANNATYSPRSKTRMRAINQLLGKFLEDIQKETNITLDIHKKDEGREEMTQFLEASMFQYKFDGITKQKSDLIKEYLIRAMIDEEPVQKMLKVVKKYSGDKITKEQVETIVRTETHAIQNKMRAWSYKKVDPDGKIKFKWINPNDDRTSPICKHLMSLTRNGVTLNKLRELIDTEAKKAGLEPREFTPHINCRSTYVRHFA